MKNKPKFKGDVIVKWRADGRTMKLLEDFSFIDARGTTWQAPAGSIVDGASIPRILWPLVGTPFAGKYRRASVLHDIACQERTRPWKKVHKMFYQAMRADKTPKSTAKQFYQAVQLFGPRWDKNGNLLRIEIDSDELYL
jgi:hypothetical protein